MKMRLPKMLAAAVLSAMGAGSVYAAPVVVSTSEEFLATSSDAIYKEGATTVILTGEVSKENVSVRDGEIKITEESSATNVNLYSINVAGKDANMCVVDGATLKLGGTLNHVGGLDGNGSLEIIGSTFNGSANELFTIGVQGDSVGNGASGTGYAEGVYADAANGSGVKFGRGDVTITSGSQATLTSSHLQMGEGSLNVDNSKVTVGNATAGGEFYKGFKATMGIGENTTSVINVANDGELTIYSGPYENFLGGFSTNYSDKSTASITVDGGKMILADTPGRTATAYVGYSFLADADGDFTPSETSTNIVVKNSGEMNFNNHETYLGYNGLKDNGSVVKISIEDKDSALNINSEKIEMHDGVDLNNNGNITIDTTSATSSYSRSALFYGGVINNGTSGKIETIHGMQFGNNNKNFAAESMVVDNKGTMISQQGIVLTAVGESAVVFTNSGSLEATTGMTVGMNSSLKNSGAVKTGTKLRLEENAVISNAVSGTIEVGAVDVYGTAQLENHGALKVAGNIQMVRHSSIENHGSLETEGYIFLYDLNGENSQAIINYGDVKAKGGVYVTQSGQMSNYGSIQNKTTIYDGGTFRAAAGSVMQAVTLRDGTMYVDGAVSLNGDMTVTDTKGSAVIVFSEVGSLDMGGNSFTVTDSGHPLTIVMTVSGRVNQLTQLEQRDLIANSATELDAGTVVTVVGKDGSISYRELGNLNAGVLMNVSGNQQAFFNTLEKLVASGNASAEMAALLDPANRPTPEALEAALDALSGHEYATAMSSQMDGNMGHLRRLRESMGKGAALSLEGIAPQGDGKCGMTTRQPLVGGISVYHEESKLDADAHGDGYDRTENGAMVNVECQVKENVTLGGAITYGRTKLHSANAMNRYEDNTRLDAYALYGDKAWSFATSFGLGMHEHELKRALGRDEVDGYSINFMQEAAYTVYGDEDSSVQLVGTLESSWNKLDSISDGRLRSNDLSAWSTDVTAGVRYNCALRVWGNAPAGMFSAQAGVRTSVGDINPSMELGMGGYTWRQDCAKSNRWGWSLSAGVDVPVQTDVSVFGAAETVLRGDYNSAGGQVGVRVAF